MNTVALNELRNGMVVRHATEPQARWFRIIALHDGPSSPSRQAHVGYLDGGGGAVIRLGSSLYEVSTESNPVQKRATEVAEAVTPSDREVLRGYSIQYHIVSEVDGQGEDCGYCNWHGKPHPITHQVYGTTWDEKVPTTWSCCGQCVLRSIDEVEDVDHEKPIIVEKVQQ